ncbi:MAG: Hsp33 family molecular chaperone HslO [Pseudomonadota bacterium]|nr:Hsp33 family molecular chaperone HslO [Pseudomonadota bacterium]
MNQPPDTDLDRLTRFLIDQAGVRGVLVHLHDTWQQIRERMGDVADVAPAAVDLLGQASAAAALFTGHAKVDGRLSVQLRSDSRLRTLFAECTASGTLRGIVQLRSGDEGGTEAGGETDVPADLRALGDSAVLAITIENPSLHGSDPSRYQGLVALDAETLSGAFEDYFHRSEQLPTRLLLAADATRAAGLMLQKLPGDDVDDLDGWTRACALFETLSRTELLDLPAETLLVRLFHEDQVRMLGHRPLGFACSCSRGRVESMLVALGEEEAIAALADDRAEVRCEFCGEQYVFTRPQIEELLAAEDGLDAPDTLQ